VRLNLNYNLDEAGYTKTIRAAAGGAAARDHRSFLGPGLSEPRGRGSPARAHHNVFGNVKDTSKAALPVAIQASRKMTREAIIRDQPQK
jgi:hypothetical protein